MFQAYVSSVSDVLDFMLQAFHLNVAKVDLDVIYAAIAIHACFNRMFQVFHLFHIYVVSVSFGCFKSTPSVHKRMQFSFLNSQTV